MGLLEGKSQQLYYQNVGEKLGSYQFTSLDDIINNFMVAYVGEDKIISKARRVDVSFHAHRAMQELSFDTFKSFKSQEIVLPNTLQMVLPHDYVNYVKLSLSDDSGIEHVLYPMSKTGNHNTIQQDADGNYLFSGGAQAHPEGPARLMQDNTPKQSTSYGFMLRNGFGINYATNQLTYATTGPFQLRNN